MRERTASRVFLRIIHVPFECKDSELWRSNDRIQWRKKVIACRGKKWFRFTARCCLNIVLFFSFFLSIEWSIEQDFEAKDRVVEGRGTRKRASGFSVAICRAFCRGCFRRLHTYFSIFHDLTHCHPTDHISLSLTRSLHPCFETIVIPDDFPIELG